MLRLSSAVYLISPLFVLFEDNGSGGSAPTIANVSGSVSGPCDVFTGGCAEAFSVARAMTSSYTGPLFQLQRISSGATLDIDQNPSTQAADMTTWSAFCGGVASNCAYKKIYAQIQIGANDLVPSTFVTNWTDCSAGGITCAAPFAIEAGTGLPITNLVAPYGYTIAADASAAGITAGTNPNSIMLNGKAGPAGTSTVGGTFGLSHQWDTGNVNNTMHEIGIAWGRAGNLHCGTADAWCADSDYEGQGSIGSDFYSQKSIILMDAVVPNSNTTFGNLGVLNGVTQWNASARSTGGGGMNIGNHLRLGVAGDLSQPADISFREGFITNTAMSSGDEAAARANMTTFYSALTFP